MRLPNAAHEAHPWRIREIAADFTLEDVWALPAHGDAEDFPTLLEVMSSLDFPSAASLPVRCPVVGPRSPRRLVRPRADLEPDRQQGGRCAKATADPGHERNVARRSAARRSARHGDRRRIRSTPFVPLYRTDVEFAAELSNRTVHAVMHLAWADQGDGATKARWPSTSSRAACSESDTWRSSSHSDTWSCTRHSCGTSNGHGIGASPWRLPAHPADAPSEAAVALWAAKQRPTGGEVCVALRSRIIRR